MRDEPVDTVRLHALNQLVIIARILVASGLTSMITSLLMGRRGIIEAEQPRRKPAKKRG